MLFYANHYDMVEVLWLASPKVMLTVGESLVTSL